METIGNNMFTEIVKAIQESVKVETFLKGEDYYSRPVYLPPKPREVDSITMTTLRGLIKFASDLNKTNIYLHVEDSDHVALVGEIGECNQREEFAKAIAPNTFGKNVMIPPPMGGGSNPVPFLERYHNIPDFLVALKTYFISPPLAEDATEEASSPLNDIIEKIGNVTKGKVVTLEDNGFTQAVSTKSSLAVGGKAEMPSEFNLIPRRSFGEIPVDKIPTSKFLLRLRSGDKENDLPMVALYEMTYPQWEAEMSVVVGKYLEDLVITVDPSVWY